MADNDAIFRDAEKKLRQKKANYAFVGRITRNGIQAFLELGAKHDKATNVFSVTKSASGAGAAKLFREGRLNVTEKNVFALLGYDDVLKNRTFGQDVSVIECLTHTSGLHTGFTDDPGEFTFKDFTHNYVRVNWSTYDIINKCIQGFSKPKSTNPVAYAFNYDNEAIQLGYCAVEAQMRVRQLIENPKRKIENIFFLNDYCANQFFTWRTGDLVWPRCRGYELGQHTISFTDLELTGRDMVKYAYEMFTNHRELLKFIYTSEFAVDANDNNVTPGSTDDSLNYKYSWGHWLPITQSRRRYVCCIGMFGQMLLIDIDNGFVAVRKHYVTAADIIRRKNAHKDFFWFIDNMLSQLGY
jgi:CubicO group peptidase (beta-lactamase class C family)